MKSVKLKKATALIFFDFECTQYDFQIIDMSFLAYKKEVGSYKLQDEIFECSSLIQTKSRVGKYVEELTGITDEQVKEGKSFHLALLELTKLLRFSGEKLFLSYGNQDLKMLFKTIDNGDETESNFYRHLKKNHLDFEEFTSSFLRDENGNKLSLVDLKNLLNVQGEYKQHRAKNDALLLAKIYEKLSDFLK